MQPTQTARSSTGAMAECMRRMPESTGKPPAAASPVPSVAAGGLAEGEQRRLVDTVGVRPGP